MRLLRCLRLDDSDDNLYPRVAAGGEWAVPGTFAFTFAERAPDRLAGAELAAFRSGFLGLTSFGWCTLATVAEIGATEHRQLLERLAGHFRDHYGAPSVDEALTEARRELEFAASLAEPPVSTILSIQRELGEDGVSESFRVHRPRQNADWQAGKPIRFVPGDIR